MPYYVYKIETFPVRQLSRLAEFDTFKLASADAKARRAALELGAGEMIKVMFAASELEAEDILSQVREKPPTIGDDY